MTDREKRIEVGKAVSEGEDVVDKIVKRVEEAEAKGDKEIRKDTKDFVNILLQMFAPLDEEVKEYKKDEAYERAMKVI